MPEVRLKKLHLADSLEALNKRVTVDTKASPDKLVKSIKAILNKAEESHKDKDEELAYLYSMRCFTIIRAIQDHEDYKQNKKYYTSFIDKKLINKILLRAEELSISLERRYGLLANANSEDQSKKEINDVKEMTKKDVQKIPEIALKVVISDGFIACDKLYSLTKEKVSSFLVVDVRNKESFKTSSIKISTLINIPEEALKPGLTAYKAGRELDENSRLLWGRRHTYDYIIICDWSTETEPFPTPITVLIDAMKKWDPSTTYRASPLVLKGGFEIFALTYPMLISNPKWSILCPVSKNSSNNTPTLNNDITQFDFTFPSLDEAFISTPSPNAVKKNAYPDIEDNSVPLFNRNLKPKIQKNEEVQHPRQKFVNDLPDSSVNNINSGTVASATSSNRSLSSLALNPAFRIPSTSSSSPSDSDDDGISSGKGTFESHGTSSGRGSLDSNISSGIGTLESHGTRSGKGIMESHGTGVLKNDLVPKVPSRTLKPQEMIESFNEKKKFLDEERLILEESFKAEKDVYEKLREMEDNRRNKELANDEDTQKKLTAKESKLKVDLEEKKLRTLEMEREYTNTHFKNEKEWDDMANLFAEQLNISSQGTQFQNRHREEKAAVKDKEEKQKILIKDVERMRRKRKEKENEMEEIRKKKELEELKRYKENEEAKEQWRLMNDRNARNSGQNVSSNGKKRPGETYTTKLRRSPRSSPVRGGSNIKRSHSAFNLSQLRDEDGFDSSSILPNFDRSLKPLNTPRIRNVNAARQRNFEPKYGSVPPTKTGLKNLGNTCYMNSIIQCLSNTVLLAKYFFDGLYSEDLNPKSNQRGEVAEEFGAVVRALWYSQYRSIAMWDLKNVVGKHHKPFQGCDQHDSHEFLIKFMDWLHDDLNLVSIKFPKMEEQNFDENIPDRLAAQSVMDGLHERDESVVRDIFYGLHRSVITCHTCSNRSLTFEPFSILTVSFPVNGRCTLKDMLYDFYKETRIEYKCSKCRRMRNCSRKLDIWKLPPVLIIHLNRFEHDVLMKKKQNFVDFPLDNLNLGEYAAGPNSYTNYDLYGVSNHFGTIDGGHYTSFCKSPHKTWYKFDDHEVYDLPRESVRTSAAYILFYEVSTSMKSSF